jgi:hypothetical protein
MASITTELVETGAKRDGRGRRIATPAERVALIAQHRLLGEIVLRYQSSLELL